MVDGSYWPNNENRMKDHHHQHQDDSDYLIKARFNRPSINLFVRSLSWLSWRSFLAFLFLITHDSIQDYKIKNAYNEQI